MFPNSKPSHFKPDSYRVQTANPEIVRKQILELALLHNLNIVSLQSEDQSLEDVFRSLTQKTE
jgi:ABC-2 type transport system ATP-binding protein